MCPSLLCEAKARFLLTAVNWLRLIEENENNAWFTMQRKDWLWLRWQPLPTSLRAFTHTQLIVHKRRSYSNDVGSYKVQLCIVACYRVVDWQPDSEKNSFSSCFTSFTLLVKNVFVSRKTTARGACFSCSLTGGTINSESLGIAGKT